MAHYIVTPLKVFEIPQKAMAAIHLELSRHGLQCREVEGGKFTCVWPLSETGTVVSRNVEASIEAATPKPPPPKPKRPLKRITVSKKPAAHLIRDKAKRDAMIQELVAAGKIKRVEINRPPEEWDKMLQDAREIPYQSPIR